jgi:signal transduction histidine kinase
MITDTEVIELKEKAADATAKAEAMQLVQEVSAGVAHNFNNILQVIVGAASLLEMTDDPDKVKHYAKMITDAAQKGIETVKRLSGYAKSMSYKGEPTRVDISKLMTDAIQYTRVFWYNRPKHAGYTIDMTYSVQPKLAIKGLENELSEVIINLIKNACEAMPEGGILHIAVNSGLGSVLIRIADSGTGIPRKVLPRIFAPFFTTKGPDGTGMGLATCRQIIEKHNGSISVSSAPGHTVFTIALPYSS